jgi:hypothetical protein
MITIHQGLSEIRRLWKWRHEWKVTFLQKGKANSSEAQDLLMS